MDWFWDVVRVCAIVIPVTLMSIAIVIELFRRRDLSGPARAGWLVLLFVFPLIGSLLYVIVTWWRAEDGRKVRATGDPERTSTISDLTELHKLRRTGAITEDEFAQRKNRVLEDARGLHTSEGVAS